jgi:hypothetical protein
MKLFGRKRTEAGATPGSASHRIMLDLERARTVAGMIAKSRASAAIEVADMVAGMYLSNWDRLSCYWDEKNHDQVENSLRRICQISPQRWNSWIEFYDGERSRSGRRNWRALLRPKTGRAAALRPSADLAAVMKEAEVIAPFRDVLDNRQLPVLTSECVLLCIARTPGSEIARRLLESGLDMAKLEQEARHPKHAPEN